MTTPEEYAGQRYEAASTIFGPNTLNAYLQQYEMLMGALLGGGGVREGRASINDVLNILTPTLLRYPATSHQ